MIITNIHRLNLDGINNIFVEGVKHGPQMALAHGQLKKNVNRIINESFVESKSL